MGIAIQQSKPYKVYTALLTQSGGDTEDSISAGTLTVGVTYRINQDSTGMDFTNVGAPNNNIGTAFVATGITPNSWGAGATYTLAYNAGAPVVTVLENTIGNIWFTYEGVGYYSIHSNGLFIQPYLIFISNNTQDSDDVLQLVKTKIYDISTSDIKTYGAGQIQNTSISSDNILFNTPIEIRVYN